MASVVWKWGLGDEVVMFGNWFEDVAMHDNCCSRVGSMGVVQTHTGGCCVLVVG